MSALFKERARQTQLLKELEYSKHPNMCLECSEPLPFQKSKNKFCDSSCAASFNCRGRIRTDESKNKVSCTLKTKISAGEFKPPTRRSYPRTPVSFITCVGCHKPVWVKTGLKCCTITCARSYTIKNGIKSKQTMYNNVPLDSSWELTIATLLDQCSIRWIRPKYIKYNIDNKSRRYFPDFYLPEYDLYLDPKNPYGMKTDSEKMKAISTIVKIEYGDLQYLINLILKLAPPV